MDSLQCPGTPVSRLFDQIPRGKRTEFLLQAVTATLSPEPSRIQYVQYPSWWGHDEFNPSPITPRQIQTHESKLDSSTQTETAPLEQRVQHLNTIEQVPPAQRFFTIDATPKKISMPRANTKILEKVKERKKMIQKSIDACEPVQYMQSRSTLTACGKSERKTKGISFKEVSIRRLSVQSPNVLPSAIATRLVDNMRTETQENKENNTSIIEYKPKLIDIVHQFLYSDFIRCLDLSVLHSSQKDVAEPIQ